MENKCGFLGALTQRIKGVSKSSSSQDSANPLPYEPATETRNPNASNKESSALPETLLPFENPDQLSSGKNDIRQLLQFTFEELKSATGNFGPDSVLGEGGLGYVYKGWIEENGTSPAEPGTGLMVAVKRLKGDALQGEREWVAEVDFLGQLHHRNLVKLIGYCIEDDQRLVVYEFMAGGSLEYHLFGRPLPLPWSRRIKIALGAAKGLAFLHGGSEPTIYRCFKTSCILLDSEYNAKLSDFGSAKSGRQNEHSHAFNRGIETFVYAAPECFTTGYLTSKSDVYGFGVMLLELLTGQRAVDMRQESGEENLVSWARPY